MHDALRLGGEVRRPRGQRAFRLDVRPPRFALGRQPLFGEQTEEGNAAETAAQMSQEIPAIQQTISRRRGSRIEHAIL